MELISNDFDILDEVLGKAAIRSGKIHANVFNILSGVGGPFWRHRLQFIPET